MTASQVAAYPFPQELPLLAQSPDVQVRFDLEEFHYSPELCGVCESAVGGHVKDAVMSVGYRFRLDVEPSLTGVCGAVHGERELDDVLHNLCQTPVEVVLHLPLNPSVPSKLANLPSGLARTPLATEDVLGVLHGIRNTQRTGEGFDGFEAARRAAIAAVSRIDTERRSA